MSNLKVLGIDLAKDIFQFRANASNCQTKTQILYVPRFYARNPDRSRC